MKQYSINIMIISAFILFYLLGDNRGILYHEINRVPINDETMSMTKMFHNSKQPHSILFDINGDNNNELIVVTPKLFLRIYSFKEKSDPTYKTSSHFTYKEVSLLANTQLRSINNVIALKVSRMKFNTREYGLIAVLTNNGILSCYDEYLHLLWKISIYETNLINMSNLAISNCALTFARNEVSDHPNELYATISYSMNRNHVIKALSERLTDEEIAVLKESQIILGKDIDLALYKNHPQLYILEKYKSILTKIVAINDVQVLLVNVDNGDIIWRNSISQHIKHNQFIPIHHTILNQHDMNTKYSDNSDYSQSTISYFPFYHHSYKDSSITVQWYRHNAYEVHNNYMDSPLRSLLPLSLFTSLKERIHKKHNLFRKIRQEQKSEGNVIVLHINQGVVVLNKNTGAFITDIPLLCNKQYRYVAVSSHFDDIYSVFLAPQPFTGQNNELASFSPCFLEIMSGNQVLSSTNICGKCKKQQNEEDEIVVLPPIILYKENTKIAIAVVTLTNEGLLTRVNMKGQIDWSKQISVKWNEFDEKTGMNPLLFSVDSKICISNSKAVYFYSYQGKLLTSVAISESLIYPIHIEETKNQDIHELVLETSSDIIIMKPSNMTYYHIVRLVIIACGIVIVLYSILSTQHSKQVKEKLM